MAAPIILDELEWRGLVAQSTDRDALMAELESGPITVYSGFDPTAPSLHAGHLIPLLTLRRFQRAGHRPIVLAGGATGMIGDPRDTGERTLNTADTVAEWADRIRGQLERFVDFDDSPTGAVVQNNLSWTSELSAVEFLRDIGKYFSVNVMLDRETVRRRLEGDGISYTEFSYMLLQANDYVELHQRYGCTLQVGGSDQWGNIIAGVRLVRQKMGATVHALTTPLVTDSEGKKFGKSTGGGSLWLDPDMTSPYAWYQYFINTADDDVVRYLRWFTFLSREELAELEQATAERPHERAAQRRLARELTTLVHGEAATAGVEHASQALFGRGSWPSSMSRRSPRHCGRHRWPSSRRVDPTPSPTCWSPADCRAARVQHDGRSARAARTSTTNGSTARSGCRNPATSCTAAGWYCVAASGILPGSSALDDVSELTHACVRAMGAERKTRPTRPFDSEFSLT